jgi:predicted amidohydrolase
MYPFGGEPSSWEAGDPVRAFPSPFGTLGAVICYDTMFTEPCRRQALNGARLIAVPTFDPYAPGYLLHHLHGATTTLRAAEHHVPSGACGRPRRVDDCRCVGARVGVCAA